MNVPAFPKPSQIKKVPVPIKVFRDGREQVNLLCKEGRDIYEARKRFAWEKQDRLCSIGGEPLRWSDSVVDHIRPRSLGRDDRQSNIAAACAWHNSKKGSKQNYIEGVTKAL